MTLGHLILNNLQTSLEFSVHHCIFLCSTYSGFSLFRTDVSLFWFSFLNAFSRMCSRVDPVKGNLKAPQNSTVLRFWCTLIGSGFVSLTDFPHLKEYDHYTNLSVPAAISPVRNVPLGMNIHCAGEGKIVWCSNRITQWEYGTLTSKSLFKWVFNYLYVLEFLSRESSELFS